MKILAYFYSRCRNTTRQRSENPCSLLLGMQTCAGQRSETPSSLLLDVLEAKPELYKCNGAVRHKQLTPPRVTDSARDKGLTILVHVFSKYFTSICISEQSERLPKWSTRHPSLSGIIPVHITSAMIVARFSTESMRLVTRRIAEI